MTLHASLDELVRTATPAELRHLAAVCREAGALDRVAPPAIRQVVATPRHAAAIAAVARLAETSWSALQAALLFEQTASARETHTVGGKGGATASELVISGPEVHDVAVRTTFAVVNDLFVSACEEVVVVGYAVHNGRDLFVNLAKRMDAQPQLRVWMCLEINRREEEASALAEAVVARYVKEFFDRQWPGSRRPDLFYDRRSLGGLQAAGTSGAVVAAPADADDGADVDEGGPELLWPASSSSGGANTPSLTADDAIGPRRWPGGASGRPGGGVRSSLHAKCIIVDQRIALITSANFTAAAQHRNIEVGVKVQDVDQVTRLHRYFLGLREAGVLVRAH